MNHVQNLQSNRVMELPKLNPNRAVDAVLWDFDGVIARTENLHVAAWQRVVRHVEIGLPADAFKTAATEDDRDLVARVFESAGVSLHTSQVLSWCAAKQEVLIQLLKMAPPIYPSVPDVMRSIATQGIRQAIVTSTWRANVQATLGDSKLLELMEFIIAKEDVARPKPSPDGYRLAVQRLGLPPSRCVALEDSPTGLSAARSSGVSVLAVAHPFSPAETRGGNWAGGARVMSDLSQLATVLAASELA